jgi:hypothetical protein
MKKSNLTGWYFLIVFILISGCTPWERKEKTLPASKKTSMDPPDPNWIGDWERDEWMSSAKLSIKAINGDTLEFTLIAFSGAHSGELEGKAIASGAAAAYEQKDEFDHCIIAFELTEDSIIRIDHKQGSCAAGAGVLYSGEYRNVKKAKGKKEGPKTLVDLGVFENYRQDSIFKALVGAQYDLFVNSTQYTAQNDDLDSVNATVNASGVKGLARYMENIIMINPRGHIWAAVIDDDKILYFTNQKKYAERLPMTIEAWRFDFQQYPVIYKSQP